MVAEHTQLNPVPIANTELHELTSSLVGQKYFIKVRIPENYHESKLTYPVLYLLDGDHAFAMATDIVQYLLYGQHVPDLIIVSPAYGSKNAPEFDGTNMRARDLVPFPTQYSDLPPQADIFLQFIEQELMPFVSTYYRVDESNRTLAGYSAGAYFALNTLFKKPTLFHQIIAIDGFDDWFLKMEEKFSEGHTQLPVKLFLASNGGGLPDFAAKMDGRGYSDFEVEYAQLSALGHFAVPADGLTKGLISVFRQ